MICVDASIVIKLFFDEVSSDQVSQMWELWQEEGTKIFAPYLLHYEIYNILRLKTRRGLIKVRDQQKVLSAYHQLDIEYIVDNSLLQRGLEISNQFELPAIYDSIYLSLCEQLDLQFITADKKLYQSVEGSLKFVQCI